MTAEDFARAVSAEIRRVLEERGMSGNQLAKAAGMDQSTVARKLRGTHAFTLNELDTVCSVLGIKASDVIEWAQRS